MHGQVSGHLLKVCSEHKMASNKSHKKVFIILAIVFVIIVAFFVYDSTRLKVVTYNSVTGPVTLTFDNRLIKTYSVQQSAYFTQAGLTVPINYPIPINVVADSPGWLYYKSSVADMELVYYSSPSNIITSDINSLNSFITTYKCNFPAMFGVPMINVTNQWSSFNGYSSPQFLATLSVSTPGYYIVTSKMTLNNGTCFMSPFSTNTPVYAINVTGLMQQVDQLRKPVAPTTAVWSLVQNGWTSFWNFVKSIFGA